MITLPPDVSPSTSIVYRNITSIPSIWVRTQPQSTGTRSG